MTTLIQTLEGNAEGTEDLDHLINQMAEDIERVERGDIERELDAIEIE